MSPLEDSVDDHEQFSLQKRLINMIDQEEEQ